MRRPLLAGNWKMYKSLSEARALAAGLKSALGPLPDRDVVVCPPFTAIPAVAQELQGSQIAWGAQNVHWEKEGAFTGEVAARMLVELGCRYVIVGHSERRQYFGETDASVNKRMHGALAVGLIPVVCVGETLAQRGANETFAVIKKQVRESLAGLAAGAKIVVAYEPVWAIGTGKTATPAQAQEVHHFLRQLFSKIYGAPIAEALQILYGGSMKPDNIKALMGQPDIDGGLVGGASLEVASFTKIVRYDA